MQRRRFKQTASLEERVAKFAEDIRKRAETMPPSKERDELLKRARSADTALQLSEWASTSS